MIHHLESYHRHYSELRASSNPDDADARLNAVLNRLRGNRDTFREILTGKDDLLAKVCTYAERLAKKGRVEPWLIISDITGNGSGVSLAIYELYRRREA